jgi:hypothetical protein
MNRDPETTGHRRISKGTRVLGIIALTAGLAGSAADFALTSNPARPKPPAKEYVYPDGSVELQGFHSSRAIAEAALSSMNKDVLPNQIWNGAFVLPPGTVLNRAPVNETVPGSQVVSGGEALILSRPRLFKEGQTIWAAGVENNQGDRTNQATDVARTVWVNMNKVAETPDGSLICSFQSDYDSSGNYFPTVIDVGVDDQANLVTVAPRLDLTSKDMAAMYTVSTENIYPQLKQLGLGVKGIGMGGVPYLDPSVDRRWLEYKAPAILDPRY